MEMFEVGGCIRDEILGVKSKDIDFVVVLDPEEVTPRRAKSGKMVERLPFEVMRDELRRRGFKIFLETKEFLTIRAQFPSYSGHAGLIGADRRHLTADFVLARKEGDYTDGRRPNRVEVGTLMDDLARRDFTMNAIAKAADGSLIDPFNGVGDIEARIIRAVGDPRERLREDALRAVRALRFSVTKNFIIEGELMKALMWDEEIMAAIADKISDERIQVELSKMFRFNTFKSLQVLNHYKGLTEAMFSGSVSLDATMKTKGRGRA